VKVNLDVKEMKVSDVFKMIKQQTQMSIVYNDADLNPDRKITLKVSDADLKSVLTRILEGTNLTYTLEKNYIILFLKSDPEENAAPEEIEVKGTVIDDNGEPLIGANVSVTGSATGTVTDIDGNYTLTVPAGSNSLTVSYIGYLPRTVTINQRKQINITLVEDTKVLDEVVVTAMGITREAKTLTYATQTVRNEELTRTKDANFINSLQGKSAGLIITPNAGGAGSASKILLRGNNSIRGENTPLIVIDGIPMQNKVQGQFDASGGDGYNMAYSAQSEGSDALSGINPEDIESMTILKGANAAALYGYAAGNGVLIITTKKGVAGKIRIDVSNSTAFETPLVLPKLQNRFGATIRPDGTLTASSWGKPIAELSDSERAIDGVSNRPYRVTDFFDTGSNITSSIAISGGTENIRNYFSYGHTRAAGIIPNNNFTRHSVTFRQTFLPLDNKRLQVDVSANYVHQSVENKISGGTVYNPLYNLYLAPRNLDMDYYRTFESKGSWLSEKVYVLKAAGSEIISEPKQVTLTGMKQNWFLGRGSSGGENNPFWLINRSLNTSLTKQFWGSAEIKYSFPFGLSAQGRIKYDRTDVVATDKKYATTVEREGTLIDRGQSDYSTATRYNLFADFILNYSKTVNRFSIASNLGAAFDRK
jgi:TonB-linked SusC/RagA family outer membrane protein